METDTQLQKQEAQQTSSELTREDLLGLIQERGGTEGLDLSRFNVSGSTLIGVMNLQGIILAYWDEQKSKWHAANLSNSNLWALNFCNAKLCGVNFSRANLRDADLIGADLASADFTGATLIHTDLTRANMGSVNLHGADLRLANLSEVDLRLAKSLKGVRLYQVRFNRTYLTKEQIGTMVGDELIHENYREAQGAYLALKQNFQDIGDYNAASWAYIKERQMEKNTHWPPNRARKSYSNELDELSHFRITRWWQFFKFYVRHLCAYSLDWIAEISCGYGEKPLRTVGWASVVNFAFAVFYWLSGGVTSTNNVRMSWLDYLNYSFGAFASIGFSNFATITPLGQTLTSIEALLGISILALLMFSLGKRISRS